MSIENALTDLKSKIGLETQANDWLLIDQERINQFADVTLDHQWIHEDVDRARKESPYKTTIAHGFLTLSLISYLTGRVDRSKPEYPGVKMAINYGLNRVRFPHAVLMENRICAREKLLSVEEVRGNGLQLVNEVTIEIEGVEKPACVAEVITRLYF